MLCILWSCVTTYDHFLSLPPKGANKGRKEIETDFQNRMLQIKATTQKSGSWSMSFSIGSLGKAATWVKYFIVVTLFGFSQSRDREVKSEKADKSA